LVVGFAVLCHDMGKAITTEKAADGRWHAYGHEEQGVPIAEAFLGRLTKETSLIEEVVPHVANHDKPSALHRAQSGDPAIRRLAKKVGRIDRLLRVDLADRQGRPPLWPGDETPHGVWLLERAQTLNVVQGFVPDILKGRHLIEVGMRPGLHFNVILKAASEAQTDGAFSDEAGARIWLKLYLESH
jgi:tRNA nucleotidyltransferase (CCA-adding enzyme)